MLDKISELITKGYRVLFLPYVDGDTAIIRLSNGKCYISRIIPKEEFTNGRVLIHLNKMQYEIERAMENDQA